MARLWHTWIIQKDFEESAASIFRILGNITTYPTNYTPRPINFRNCKCEAIPELAPRVPGIWGSQISRKSAFEGGKDVSRTHRPPLHPGNTPGTHCYRLIRSQGHSVAGRILSMKNSSDTIRNRTYHLSACSAVPQPTAVRRAQRVLVARPDGKRPRGRSRNKWENIKLDLQ
jgi:hypothetical protein